MRHYWVLGNKNWRQIPLTIPLLSSLFAEPMASLYKSGYEGFPGKMVRSNTEVKIHFFSICYLLTVLI